MDRLMGAAFADASGGSLGRCPIVSERFELIRELGQGGMGAVYEARDVVLDRLVALKAIHTDLPRMGELRARFLREARILSGLEHPNVCRLYDFVQEEGGDFLVMELIDGQTLAEALEGELPRVARLRLAMQIAEGLGAAHESGVVHRDLKPSNVMIDRSGVAKVLDFGVAFQPTEEQLAELGGVRPEPRRRTEPLDASSRLTTSGRALGTPRYMSPEQLHGKEPLAASDMYSFGRMLVELLPGLAEAKPWRLHVPGMGRVRQLVRALLSASPAARPTARLAAEELAEALATPGRWATRSVLGLGGAAILGLGIKYTVDLGHEKDQVLARQRQAERMIDFLVGDAAERIEVVGPPELILELDRQALLYFDEVASESLSDFEQRKRITTLTGFAMRALGHERLDTAHAILERCEAFAQARLVDDPEQVEWLFELSQIQFYLGQVHRDLGDELATAAAWTSYLQSAERLTALEPGRAAYQDELAWARTNLGVLHLEAGRPEDSLGPFTLALEHWEAVSNPEEILDAISWRAQAHHFLGHLAAAEGLYRRELDERQALLDADPENDHFAHGIALARHHLARVLQDQGRAAEALEHAEQGLASVNALATKSGGHAAILRTEALLHSLVGGLFEQLERYPQAQLHHAAAIELVVALRQRDPGNQDLLQLHAALLLGAAGNDLAMGLTESAAERAGTILGAPWDALQATDRWQLQRIEASAILARAGAKGAQPADETLALCEAIRSRTAVPLLAHRAWVLELRVRLTVGDRPGAQELAPAPGTEFQLPPDLTAALEEQPHE
ncbi:MAG: serine/threonine-protein kinase [Planctomycetota bacterium]|nr:serine/threonine-protein kinase [Planctomycetota bacterium]